MATAVYPTFYGREPPVDATALAWEDTRPDDAQYWRLVARLKRRGGFFASARLVALHSAPGQDPLLALQLARQRGCYFPVLLLPGALDGTAWQGVPVHLSLCYAQECPPWLVAAAQRRWGHWRRVWVSCSRVSSGATCILGRRGALARCRILRQMHHCGWYSKRELHISL